MLKTAQNYFRLGSLQNFSTIASSNSAIYAYICKRNILHRLFTFDTRAAIAGNMQKMESKPKPPHQRTRTRPLPLCAKIAVALLFFGLVFSIVGSIIIPMVFNTIVTNVVEEIMVIKNNTQLFDGWSDPSGNMPLYQGFYFFDVQNKEGIMNGEKPEVVEVGPYTYKMIVTRENISFHDEDAKVSYLQYMSYHFEPEMSVGSDEDIITTLNIPFMGAANGAKYKTFWERLSMSAIGQIHSYGAFKEISVKDLLGGYKDPMLQRLQLLAGKHLVPTDVFGILHTQNATNPNWFTVYTGADNSSLVSTVSEWNGTDTLPWWGTKEANMINGTDGSMYHTNIKRDEVLELFNPLNFRSIPYVYQHDTDFEGIPLYHYHVPRYAFANPKEYSPNEGFCLEDDEDCVPTGVFNISVCSEGAPMLLSHPHFLYGDKSLINAIDGIEPNETIHQNSMDIEPIMGVPFVVNQRIQINMYIEEVEGIAQTYGLKPTYFPILWIDTDGVLPDARVQQYHDGLKLSRGIVYGGRYGCIGSGVLCLFLFILIIKYYRDRKDKVCDKEQMKETQASTKDEYIPIPSLDKDSTDIPSLEKDSTEALQNGSTKGDDPVPV